MVASTTPAAGEAGAQSRQRPTRLTALYEEHVGRGARMEERDGWLLPRSYTDRDAEQQILQTSAGLLDIGESGKIDLKSSALDAVIAGSFSDAAQVEVGTSLGVGDGQETRIYRLTGEHALIVTPPADLGRILDLLSHAALEHPCTHSTDITGALCGIRLVGPHAPALLERLSSLDLAPDRFADGALAQGGLARAHALIARRDGAGLIGYDLYVDRDLGVYLWETLLEAGAPLTLMPVGRDAEEE